MGAEANTPMMHTPSINGKNRCMACGSEMNGRKGVCCSTTCQGYLMRKLSQHTGLLASLNTRFAAFSFTPGRVMLDIFPAGYDAVYRFVRSRSANTLPADDFSRLITALSSLWWREWKRSNKKHVAVEHVVRRVGKRVAAPMAIKPKETVLPSVKKKYLKHLRLRRDELIRPLGCRGTIKTAYRMQVKKVHPDLGGSEDEFRKIHHAYEQLMLWARDPSFITQRGLPEKWCYDGDTGRWLPPTGRIS